MRYTTADGIVRDTVKDLEVLRIHNFSVGGDDERVRMAQKCCGALNAAWEQVTTGELNIMMQEELATANRRITDLEFQLKSFGHTPV